MGSKYKVPPPVKGLHGYPESPSRDERRRTIKYVEQLFVFAGYPCDTKSSVTGGQRRRWTLDAAAREKA
jgi:hypothetical protein